VFTTDYLDGILTHVQSFGGMAVEVEGRTQADALVDALGDRAESVIGDAHVVAFSGVEIPGKYTLTVKWCGKGTVAP
jgi:hypothetical protein